MIRKADKNDISILIPMALNIFENTTYEELERDFNHIFEISDRSAFFIKYDKNDNDEMIPVGFSLCQLRRDYVEGCKSNPVGYLEGIYVDEKYRHKGYAKELLDSAISYAKEKGCTEFASDCDIDNDASHAFHLSMGFSEANRIICFAKKI